MQVELQWTPEPGRILARCGNIAVGAVYPGLRRWRWRAWVTKNMNPVEQTAANETKAKEEVAERFGEFLRLAKLEQRREP